MNKENNFNCVEMKNKIQEIIYEKVKSLTPEEEMEYLRNSIETNPLVDKWKAIQKQQEERMEKAG